MLFGIGGASEVCALISLPLNTLICSLRDREILSVEILGSLVAHSLRSARLSCPFRYLLLRKLVYKTQIFANIYIYILEISIDSVLASLAQQEYNYLSHDNTCLFMQLILERMVVLKKVVLKKLLIMTMLVLDHVTLTTPLPIMKS